MPHTVRHNPETNCIEMTAKGDVSWNEVKEIIADCAAMARDKGCTLFLNDFREAKVSLGTVTIYRFPKVLEEIVSAFGLNPRQLKRAFVGSGDVKDFMFLEAVTANVGQWQKVFTDLDEAKEWLFAE